ncbi:MAG: insulinase family protein [Oscillospiraceae bacterium]|nr:insulinase family protein [Oscillospiraceae bacterium]
MSYKTEEIKQGIKLHTIATNKFKTNLLAVIITMPLSRETITLNTLLPAVLKRGTVTLDTQEKINAELENMYGSTFDCGIDKIGDNHVIKFYLESLNDNFIPKKGDSLSGLKQSINLILDIIFNPLVENNRFKEEYVNSEKNNIKTLIESRIDNKDSYALSRCTEEMYEGQPYGLYKYGYSEDLNAITAESLYLYYMQLKESSKIDIFVSGDINREEVRDLVIGSENILKLKGRTHKAKINNEQTEGKEVLFGGSTNEPKVISGEKVHEDSSEIVADSEHKKKVRVIEEKMDVGQGKLVMGLDVGLNEKDAKFPIAVYNVILGESATSKLFQNVREKASLAYTIRSNYVRQKSNIYIRSGIEIDKYEKALEIIEEQLNDVKEGQFTDEELQTAKKYIESGIKSVIDEQDSEITYYIGQELSGGLTTFEEYIEKIKAVTKDDILRVAGSININTIYFLRN